MFNVKLYGKFLWLRQQKENIFLKISSWEDHRKLFQSETTTTPENPAQIESRLRLEVTRMVLLSLSVITDTWTGCLQRYFLRRGSRNYFAAVSHFQRLTRKMMTVFMRRACCFGTSTFMSVYEARTFQSINLMKVWSAHVYNGIRLMKRKMNSLPLKFTGLYWSTVREV